MPDSHLFLTPIFIPDSHIYSWLPYLFLTHIYLFLTPIIFIGRTNGTCKSRLIVYSEFPQQSEKLLQFNDRSNILLFAYDELCRITVALKGTFSIQILFWGNFSIRLKIHSTLWDRIFLWTELIRRMGLGLSLAVNLQLPL